MIRSPHRKRKMKAKKFAWPSTSSVMTLLHIIWGEAIKNRDRDDGHIHVHPHHREENPYPAPHRPLPSRHTYGTIVQELPGPEEAEDPEAGKEQEPHPLPVPGKLGNHARGRVIAVDEQAEEQRGPKDHSPYEATP